MRRNRKVLDARKPERDSRSRILRKGDRLVGSGKYAFFSFAVPSQSELIVFGPKPIGPFTRVEHGPLRRD